jgi:hypothetical protein
VSFSVSRSIRRQALQKIAALSATSSTATFDNSDLDRLCIGCPGYGQSNPKSNGLGKESSKSLAGSPMVCADGYNLEQEQAEIGDRALGSSRFYWHFAKLHLFLNHLIAPRSSLGSCFPTSMKPTSKSSCHRHFSEISNPLLSKLCPTTLRQAYFRWA